MSPRNMSCLLPFLLVILLQCDVGTALQLHISPERFTHDKEKNVTLTCKLDKSEATAKEVMVLKIAKEGEKAIAIIHPNNIITVRNSAKDRVKAFGKIEEDPISNSYLSFVIKKPHLYDSGEYSCHIYYMNIEGLLVDDSATDFLIVEDRDKKILKNNVNKLLDWTKETDQRISALNKKGAGPMIGFSATRDNKLLRPVKGTTLVFPDIITKQGQGYDPRTGIFTVSQKGIYVFNLVLQTGCQVCFVKAQVVANSNVRASVRVSNEEDSRQGSVTAVMELSPGDKVKVHVADCSEGVYLMFKKFCMFSGFLMKAI